MGLLKQIKVGIIEALVIALLFSVFIYSRLQGMGDYVFIYPFNIKDGSIYWALFFSILFGGMQFFLNLYYAIPKYLKNKQLYKYILSIIILFFGLLGMELHVKAA